MVDRRNVLIVREDCDILWIFSADRQTAHQGQKTGLLISAVHGHTLVACIAAEHMLLIWGEA